MLIFNYISIFIILAIIVTSLLCYKFKFNFIEYLNNNKYINYCNNFCNNYFKYICLLIIAIGIFVTIYELDKLPMGIHVDEAGMAYDSMSIANYGVDRYLNKLPVYLINFGGGQSAMYAYIAAVLIKIFGYSLFIVRLPAVILKISMLICAFILMKNSNNKLFKVLLTLLLSIVPYFIMSSRWGLDCNLLLGFITIAITLLIQSLNDTNKTIKKITLLIFSSVFFGLALYTYALSYLIIPLMLIFICIYLLYIRKLKFTDIIIFGIPMFILAIPLMLMLLVNNGYIDQINSFITIPKLISYRGSEVSLSNINDNLYIFKSIFSIDKDPALTYNSIKEFGTIYYCLIPFFIMGIIYGLKNIYLSIKNKKFCIDAIMFFWGISVIICQLLIINPNINKANAIFFPILYFVVIGIVNIVKNLKILLLPILILLIINFSLFINYYFNSYNKDNYNNCFVPVPFINALEYIQTMDNLDIILSKAVAVQEHIYINLFNNISPYNFSREVITVPFKDNKTRTYKIIDIKDIDITNENNCIYVLPTDSDLSKELTNKNYNFKTFDYVTVFYK